MIIDSHAHVYLEQFDEDRPEAMARAREAGVGKIYMPNIDPTSIEGMLETERAYPDLCRSMMGLHPCSVGKNFEKDLQVIEGYLSEHTFAAVGEIGTDLYWDKTYWGQQVETFQQQLQWATQKKLPVVIHSRESLDESISLVEEKSHPDLTGVFHCFTGTLAQAKRIITLGFKLGIGGVATFKNGGLGPILEEVSLDHMLLETDSPYLAPHPNRGKRNEPSYLALVASKIADVKGVPLEEVARVTTANALDFFK